MTVQATSPGSSISPHPHRKDLLTGSAITVVAVAVAVLARHWTVLLVPIIWFAVLRLTSIPAHRRFAVLVAATVVLPHYPLRSGISLDDVIPLATALAGLALLVILDPPRLPRVISAAFAVWILAGLASAMVNAHGLSNFISLAAPGAARPLLWLILLWSAMAFANRYGLKGILTPIALVAILEAAFSIAMFAGSAQIQIGAPSTPANQSVWETRRPLGIEQGAGTSVQHLGIRSRTTGTLGLSSNFFGAYLVVVLPAVVGLALASRERRRWLFLIGSALVFLAMFLTFTRASLLAAAVAVAITLLLASPRRVLPVAVALLVALALAAALVPQVRARLSDPANDRRALWYSGYLIFRDHPLLGVGYGNYATVQRANPRYMDTPYGQPSASSHNGFIGIAAEGGALQLGAVLAIVIFLLVGGWRVAWRARGTPEGLLLAAAFGGAGGFVMQNMTNTLLLVPAVATFFWAFGGGLLGSSGRQAPGDIAPEIA